MLEPSVRAYVKLWMRLLYNYTKQLFLLCCHVLEIFFVLLTCFVFMYCSILCLDLYLC
ncbi:hypothetical protein HanPSC8_Chr09g0358381 [Helianthus annuus]|nr:hypothetical protein HanPSC8_Chr09g0358381 [Helianthus annuus]